MDKQMNKIMKLHVDIYRKRRKNPKEQERKRQKHADT
jgi:hypothetical protein